MADVVNLMPSRKRIALIAHDNCKAEMLEWAEFNRDAVITQFAAVNAEVGAAIAEGRIDFLVFFWDPLQPQPHDVDVKALLRIAVVCNVPTACNRATADFVLSSPLTREAYQRPSSIYAEQTAASQAALNRR